MKVGLGMVTYNRPNMFKQSLKGCLTVLHDVVDEFAIYNDGAVSKTSPKYRAIFSTMTTDKIAVFNQEENRGVGHAKNHLMQHLLDKGCDYIFIVEDDIIPVMKEAITGYIYAHEKTGISHLNFAHHGTLNPAPIVVDSLLTFWPNCVGAWSFYTREVLETVGLIDEHFVNVWDHVEHTKRIAAAGFTSPFWYFADCTNSELWINELPKAIETSQIRQTKSWESRLQEGLDYWRQKDGEGIPPRPSVINPKPWKWEE